MHSFPIIGGYHLNRVPWTAIEKGAVGSFANAFLTADAEIGINFDAAKGRMIFVGDPEHAGFNRTIFDASRRPRTPRAAVSGDCKYSWSLLARGLAVAFRHGPMFFYDIEQNCAPLLLVSADEFLARL
jgi:hypothetical protein